jgi:inorganic pyrophosphatase
MEEINVLVEIPKSSSVKYEIDKNSGLLVVDRFMHTAMSYPFNYGFIPNTYAKDGDAVDVMVVSSHPVQAGCVLPSRVIGMLEMEDEAGSDNKIIAVPTKKIDPFYGNINDMDDLDEATKKMIKHFFEFYKSIEPGKWVKISGFVGKDAALKEIKESCMQ